MKMETIRGIAKASGVHPGELILVHFWGEDEEKHIANQFMCAVAELGAAPILLQQARTMNQSLFAGAADQCFGDKYFEVISSVDAVLDIFSYQPIILGGKIGEQGMARYRTYIARLFHCLMKAKRFAQIRIPTRANAEESGLEEEEYIWRMQNAYDVDYDQLQVACERYRKELMNRGQLTLRTGADCQLEFELSGREWHIDAGDGDWPCGEIYIAPVEEYTRGDVYFECLHLEEQGVCEQVIIHVEGGRAVSSSHKAVDKLLRELSGENSVVCELGFGMNPNVKDLCGYRVLDEKMAGTFHIALGANHMFGGKNAAPMHLDLVGAGPFAAE